jgi:hypothetical protein
LLSFSGRPYVSRIDRSGCDWAWLTVPSGLGPKFAAFFRVSAMTDC